MSSSERVVRTTDGLGLFVRDYLPEGDAQGLPVLCLHGLTRNSRDFEVVAERVAALGRRVIAMDVRGRGRSDWDPVSQNYAIPTYMQDALRVLDQLGAPKAIWLGSSMGGLISMLAGAVAPARVSGIILNDVGPELEPAGLARIVGYVGASQAWSNWEEAARAIAAINGAAYPNADAAFWAIMAKRTHKARADGRIELDYDPAIAVGSGTQAIAPDLKPMFRELKAPILVLRGALSDLLSRRGVDLMKGLKPDIEAVEVPGVGHAPTLEEPAAWLPIVDFLAKLP